MVLWLRLNASTAVDMGSIPGWRTKIPHAIWPKKKKERKEKRVEAHGEEKSVQGRRYKERSKL